MKETKKTAKTMAELNVAFNSEYVCLALPHNGLLLLLLLLLSLTLVTAMTPQIRMVCHLGKR
jgi:hypothetical protein